MSYLNITEKDLKQIKDWKVGSKYVLQIEVELKTLSQGEYYGTEIGAKQEEVISGSFEIESVQEVDSSKKVSYKKMYAAARQGKVA